MTQTIEQEALALISAHRHQHASSAPATAAVPKSDDATNNNRKIDVDQANRHLELCGIGPQDPVILCAYGIGNRYVPDRPAGAKNYVWQLVTNEASEGSRRYDLVEVLLKNPDGRTPSFGFISCLGGTRVKCLPGRDDF